MQKYYITNVRATATTSLCNFTLLMEENIPLGVYSVLQITLPDDIPLEKTNFGYKYHGNDTLGDYEFHLYIMRNKKWIEWDQLKDVPYHRHNGILDAQGYHLVPNYGYLNATEFRAWFKKLHPEEFTKRKVRPGISKR